MIKCPNCGANLIYKIEAQRVRCPFCSSEFDPKEAQIKINQVSEQIGYEGKEYSCSDCGARILTFDDTAITFCSYCGSQAMLQERMLKQNNPDVIIPFKKTKEDCIKAYKSKVRKSLFAPSYMKDDIVINKFRGIYMPYGIYKLSFHGKDEDDGSKFAYGIGDYDYYNDYHVTCDIDADYTGISFDLVSKYYDDYSKAIPFDFKEAEPFNFNYMSGFYADVLDKNAEEYDMEALRIAKEDSRKYKSTRKFRKYGCQGKPIHLQVASRGVGMFPVYFLAVRNQKENKISYAVINGQTGKVAIDLPIDIKKYVIFACLITIPIYILYYTYLLLSPNGLCLLATALSGMMLIILKKRINIIEEKKLEMNKQTIENKQEGFSEIIKELVPPNITDPLKQKEYLVSHHSTRQIMNLFKKKDKKSRGKYTKLLMFPIFAIIITLIPLITSPVNDIYYYIPIILGFILNIYSFFLLISVHNQLTMNELPQLSKRGGEE